MIEHMFELLVAGPSLAPPVVNPPPVVDRAHAELGYRKLTDLGAEPVSIKFGTLHPTSAGLSQPGLRRRKAEVLVLDAEPRLHDLADTGFAHSLNSETC